MTPEQINRAIAESVGCELVSEGHYHPDNPVYTQPPDYYGDLNACAEFEKTLTQGSAKQVIHATNRYTNELCKILKCLDTALFQFTIATAPQRCEAYLRTMNLWRDQ